MLSLGGKRGERSALFPSHRHLSNAAYAVTLRDIAYRHLLVAYDATSEGDEAIVAADLLAQQDGSRLTVVVVAALFGPPHRAIPDGANEFDCDAIVLPPRARRRPARLISRDQAAAIRRRASCEVLQPR